MRTSGRLLWCIWVVLALDGREAVGLAKCSVDNELGNGQGFRLSARQFVEMSPAGWSMAIEGKGRVLLRVTEGNRRFRLSSEALHELKSLVNAEDIWSLDTTYGTQSAVGPFREIGICDGSRVRTVTVHADLSNEPRKGEIRRFLRVGLRLRKLFTSRFAASFQESDIDLILGSER